MSCETVEHIFENAENIFKLLKASRLCLIVSNTILLSIAHNVIRSFGSEAQAVSTRFFYVKAVCEFVCIFFQHIFVIFIH